MGKMFTYNGKRMKTWNFFTGCQFDCTYCWSRKLISTRLKNTPKYNICGFSPTFHLKELDRRFQPDDFVFISSMGDIYFASETPEAQSIFDMIYNYAKIFLGTNFLLCTKNPILYVKYDFPNNVHLGTTIETNRPLTKLFSKAPEPLLRYGLMASLENKNPKFISIEPIMDFDLPIFTSWITRIHPKIVEIGADNYHNSLPEPSGEKVKALISSMENNGITVIKKSGLERIIGKEN